MKKKINRKPARRSDSDSASHSGDNGVTRQLYGRPKNGKLPKKFLVEAPDSLGA